MDQKELLEIIEKAAREGYTILGLQYMNITSLPAEIGQLTNLIALNLNGNQLGTIPAEIGQLTNLIELKLSNVQLSSLPVEIGKLTKLSFLDLGSNKFSSLPTEIGQLFNLQKLNLCHNQLSTLPPEVGQLFNLQELDLRHNQLSTLPPEIGQLANLAEFSLGENQLSTLPPEIGQLANLKKFYLGPNQLSVLPPEIGKLTNLSELAIFDNQLNTLPLEIGKLTNLSELVISDNQLSTLPAEIGQLANLKVLTLSDNQFSILPSEIGQLTNLLRLDIDNNPLISPPSEVVAQGQKAILAYLREQLEKGQPQWVSKMLLVGQGGVGKTQLLRRLRGEAFDPAIPTTHGIAVQTLKLRHPTQSGVTMQLNAWDFGGQEIYHATHQFFLTDRSLFLLVWNARHGFEQGKLYYWLDAIQARAPESPVLIVATQTDERDADLPLAEIKAKYPQVVDQWSVSNLTGAGIDDLRAAITQTAAKLPLMGEMWPKTWLEAANDLRARKEKHITPQEMQAAMRARGVSEEGLPVLARWLHELGDILYFRDDDELCDLVILKPQWASAYISRVVEDEQVIAGLGVFTREQMIKLWADLPSDLREHFLRLMEAFDLSYRTLEQREISLVVERLPLDPPPYQAAWDAALRDPASHEIAIRYRLNSLPPGIPTWFIARAHRFTVHKHWRNGALFACERDGSSLALVQAFPHERYLQLSVRGAHPHNFFALLKDGLELTLDRYPGLKLERKIPCPGHNGQPCPHEFDYEQLLKRLDKKPRIECPEALIDVDVRTLLFGLTPATLDDVQQKLDALLDLEAAHHDELVSLLQREFMKNFRREQSQDDAFCPNVLTLRPLADSSWKRALLGEKVELQLYCQQPGCWHPTKEGGRYLIPRPVEWLQKTGPYLKSLMILLKYVSPFVGPWVGMVAADYKKLVEDDLSFMDELLKVMPDLVDDHELDLARMTRSVGDRDDPSTGSGERVHGAALRAIRQLLDEVDPSQKWGNLRKVFTPEGHYLWLCEYHAREYLL